MEEPQSTMDLKLLYVIVGRCKVREFHSEDLEDNTLYMAAAAGQGIARCIEDLPNYDKYLNKHDFVLY
jgi:hypothetical protein